MLFTVHGCNAAYFISYKLWGNTLSLHHGYHSEEIKYRLGVAFSIDIGIDEKAGPAPVIGVGSILCRLPQVGCHEINGIGNTIIQHGIEEFR